MGLAQLTKIALVVPKSDFQVALRKLSEFEWFDPEEPEVRTPDPEISSLSTRVYRLYLELNEVVEELGVRGPPGLMDIIFKGQKVEKEKMRADDWEDLVNKIEEESRSILKDTGKLIEERKGLEKSISDQSALRAALQLISSFSVDLSILEKFRRFTAIFAIATTKDVNEIRRSLPDILIYETSITKAESAILVVGSIKDLDRIDKVLRSYDVKPFIIPQELPQNPAQAYRAVEADLNQLRKRLNECITNLFKVREAEERRLLVFRDLSYAAYRVLEDMKRVGGLTRFAMIRGYVPDDRVRKLEKICRDRWIFLSETPEHHESHGEEVEEGDGPPALMTNRGFAKAFENITLTQGPPRYGEIDPTPIIALIFPIFYGIMFGDFGQGLILLLFGLLIRSRKSDSLSQWGTLLAAAGGAATVMGLITGEAFGLELPLLPVVGEAFHNIQLLQMSAIFHEPELGMNVVRTLLVMSILFGAIHLTIGFALDIVKSLKHNEKVEVVTFKLPTLTMYLSGILFALAFIINGYKFKGLLTSSTPTPLGLTVSQLQYISLPIIFTSIIVIICGKAVAIALGKVHGESMGMALMMGIIEFLLRVVEFLANTISYARLGILLIVHASLMFAVNLSLGLGVAGLPIVVIGNIGVMVLEGLIVFIQDLRLHLYEWFTKFYEGSGRLFKKILPETTYVDIEWS